MDLEPKLPVHNVVPLFTLPDKHGQPHNLARQRGREHFVLLIFGDAAAPARYLESLAARAAEWRQLPARGIVVVRSADQAGALGALPFTLLVDAAGRVSGAFLPDGAIAGVFALDRYGDLYRQWLVGAAADLPTADDIDGWLQAISMQCSI